MLIALMYEVCLHAHCCDGTCRGVEPTLATYSIAVRACCVARALPTVSTLLQSILDSDTADRQQTVLAILMPLVTSGHKGPVLGLRKHAACSSELQQLANTALKKAGGRPKQQ
jgi:hypothetical protein